MDVYWLEQSEADMPARDSWLSAREALVLNGIRFSMRRGDWRLGRWTAKRALAVYLNVPADPEALAAIEITPAASGAPQVVFANEPAPVTISLSHRSGRAMCAVAEPDVELGCDLEIIEPRSDAFAADYFTAEEQALVARASSAADRYRLLALLWSAKESALKAMRVGLRCDTRCVAVSLSPAEGLPRDAADGWHPLAVQYQDRTFHGWWHNHGIFLRTLVGSPAPLLHQFEAL
jgi:4'-phosphopantetheinyl transferase